MRCQIMVCTLMLCICGCAASKPQLPVASDFTADVFLGNWHEVARLPHPLEVHCAASSFEFLPVAANRIKVHQYCWYKSLNGPMQRAYADIRIPDVAAPHSFIIQFGGPLAGRFQVMFLSRDQSVALLGETSRRYLWLLSRKLSPSVESVRAALRVAQDSGYDLSVLVFSQDLLSDVKKYSGTKPDAGRATQ